MSHTRLLSSSERAASRSMESGKLFRNKRPSRESILVAQAVSVNLDRKPYKPIGVLPDLKSHMRAINYLLDNLNTISKILRVQEKEIKNE